jgi:hypothetical protein
VLDGASATGLVDLLYDLEPEHECLYSGELEPDLVETAPYLARLEPDSAFLAEIISRGWGKNWGVFVRVDGDTSLRDLRKHFRTLLMVQDPEGRLLYFRFYDPRVLRVFLPTCNHQELAALFGPIGTFVVEGESPGTALLFRFDTDRGLVTREVPLTAAAQ